jgi:hypothetical protein
MKILCANVRRSDKDAVSICRTFSGLAEVLTLILIVAALISVPREANASGAAAAAPRVVVCGGTPVVRPRTMHWCTSMCSSYMTGIVWKSWTADGASGVGTLMTNDGVPSCGQGTWTKHTASVVILGNARTAEYCTESGDRATALLFTATNLWGGILLPASRC